jgi:two-component system KDP operon response regulator KdpE
MVSAEPHRVLVVEDERPMRRFLVTLGRSHGLSMFEAESAAAALAAITEAAPDVVLLDLGLPDADGIALTRTIREWSAVPIIVISARGMERDKVTALDAGADDYLTKPFSAGELLARIRVALRHGARTRTDLETTEVVRCGPLEIDLAARRVRIRETEIHLTPIEYKLLVCLARRPGRVLTHQQILDDVWGASTTARHHHVRVHMAQLRRKLEADPARPRFVLTEVGVGYRFADADPG